ncbi:tetratricopeptide repeat protein [Labrys wisconsinensis]|uniref:Tetratricopeptide (TPR) repeat protein n=1 Tax=Labrys wisconsinensis TaxID=425677 RepID=A0ABU0J6P6_9HYPH|nr:hypothetical protein [Labrys wisconsinensis]MDQ0469941.1 tetratricopeptide (TPR) repeat protein [Labrys wisconsinensis]
MKRTMNIREAQRLLSTNPMVALKAAEVKLSSSPDDYEGLRVAGQAATKLRLFDKAANYWVRAAEAHDGDFACLVRAAGLSLRGGKPRSAFEIAGRALLSKPDDPAALKIKAEASDLLVLPSDCVDAAIRLAKSDREAAVKFAESVLAMGDPKGAARILAAVGEGGTVPERVIGLVAAAVTDLARRAQKLGDEFNEAAALRALMLIRPGDDRGVRRLRRLVKPHLDDAQKCMADGDLHGARAAYRQVLEIDPFHAPGLKKLAELESRLESHAEASRLLGRLVAVTPAEPSAHFLLARELEAIGSHESAVDSVVRARELGYPAERCDRAVARLARKLRDFAKSQIDASPEAALHAAEAIFKIDHENLAAKRIVHKILPKLHRGLALARKSHDYDEAYRFSGLLCRIMADDDTMWRRKANASLRLRRYDDAIDALKQALRIAGENEDDLVLLAESYRRAKRHAEGAEVAARARQLAPFSSAVHDLLERLAAHGIGERSPATELSR